MCEVGRMSTPSANLYLTSGFVLGSLLIIPCCLNTLQVIASIKAWRRTKPDLDRGRGAITIVAHRVLAAVMCILVVHWFSQGFFLRGVWNVVGLLLNDVATFIMFCFVLYAAYQTLRSAYLVSDISFPTRPVGAVFILLGVQLWVLSGFEYTHKLVTGKQGIADFRHICEFILFVLLFFLLVISTLCLLYQLRKRQQMMERLLVGQGRLTSQISRHLSLVAVLIAGCVFGIIVVPYQAIQGGFPTPPSGPGIRDTDMTESDMMNSLYVQIGQFFFLIAVTYVVWIPMQLCPSTEERKPRDLRKELRANKPSFTADLWSAETAAFLPPGRKNSLNV